MFSVKINCKDLPAFVSLMNEYPAITDANIRECMETYLADVERIARNNAPVDTGRLRGDIGIKMQANGNSLEGMIFNTSLVKYAIFVHEGTKYMKARPYLRNAIFATKSQLTRLLQQNVLKAKRGFAGISRAQFFGK